MRTTGAAAAAYMRSLALHGASGVKNKCLQTCRLAWGLPAQDPSAIAEWRSIPEAHKRYSIDDIPVGAPVFFTKKGSRYGHITIAAAQHGFVWSTDAPVTDRVGLVRIGWFMDHWRYKFLGWSTELNGKQLPLDSK